MGNSPSKFETSDDGEDVDSLEFNDAEPTLTYDSACGQNSKGEDTQRNDGRNQQ